MRSIEMLSGLNRYAVLRPVPCLRPPHSHSIVNKLRKLSAGAGFAVVIIVNTMKNTMSNIFC